MGIQVGVDNGPSWGVDWPRFVPHMFTVHLSSGGFMSSVARVTTITSRSETSFEDAIRQGIERAAQTLRNIQGAWVKEQEVTISDGVIQSWQVVLEVTFVLE
jgi:flavin-binding protein dodecin